MILDICGITVRTASVASTSSVVSQLGGDEATSVLTADFLSSSGVFFRDAEESGEVSAHCCACVFPRTLIRGAVLELGYSVSVPPYVVRRLFSRSFDNDESSAKLRKPVLITHHR